MIKFIRLIKGVYLLSKRLKEDEARQHQENYLITSTQEGPERYIKYSDGDLEIDVIAEFTWANDVVIYTDSLKNFRKNPAEQLSPENYERVLQRLVRYFSCWGGTVSLTNKKLLANDNIKEMLNRSGIAVSENDDGVIQYSADVDDLRSKRLPPFDR